jgi:UDP-glucose 6-dehydrogenase
MEFCGNNIERAVSGAKAILIMTEWDCFKEYDYRSICSLMTKKTIYDFRCFMDKAFLSSGACFDNAF